MHHFTIFFILISIYALGQQNVDGEVISLNNNNIDSVLAGSDIAIVNFYADWCRFSQILAPTFEEAGKKVKEEFPIPGRIVFAKVDCDRENDIASRYRISKYPTLKLFRGGSIVKKEYRGQRSVEALAQFAKEQAKDPINEIAQLDQLDDIDDNKRHIIGYFDSKTSDNYRVFSRVANILRDDCGFHAALGPVSLSERTAGDHISFRAPHSNKRQDVPYTGQMANYDTLLQWATDSCLPLVREITFENAEELTEEGLPFLILFHHPDDTAVVELFNRAVASQIMQEKVNVNFLVADGLKFAHPLHHLGKTTDDLPVLAIDSFRHMYLFPHDVKQGLNTPGLLKQFVEDLHSGKLHREFHHGPDSTPSTLPVIQDNSDTKNIPRDTSDEPKPPAPAKITSPPESTFKKLAPSRNRYTILRDEL